jgi:hypothetical protein
MAQDSDVCLWQSDVEVCQALPLVLPYRDEVAVSKKTNVVGLIAASYANVPISNVDNVTEDREERCIMCDRDDVPLMDGAVCQLCVEERDGV